MAVVECSALSLRQTATFTPCRHILTEFCPVFYRAVPRTQNILLKMTNLSAGSKRSWEGGHGPDSHKRPRERDDPRDWRDAHLRSPRRKTHPSPRDGPSRRDNTDRRSRYDIDSRARSREREYKRSGDSGRDRDRRDDRDRMREREYYSRKEDPRRDVHRSHSTANSRDGRENGSVKVSPHNHAEVEHPDSEKEEGE